MYLDDINPTVEGRKCGKICYMPVALSIDHFKELISSILQQKYPERKHAIPLEE